MEEDPVCRGKSVFPIRLHGNASRAKERRRETIRAAAAAAAAALRPLLPRASRPPLLLPATRVSVCDLCLADCVLINLII